MKPISSQCCTSAHLRIEDIGEDPAGNSGGPKFNEVDERFGIPHLPSGEDGRPQRGHPNLPQNAVVWVHHLGVQAVRVPEIEI